MFDNAYVCMYVLAMCACAYVCMYDWMCVCAYEGIC